MSKEPHSTVNIVENDASFRRLIQTAMEKDGYQVVVFSTSEQFLVEPESLSPVCLLVNIRLPGISSIDFMKELHERGNRTPIIFVSSVGNNQTAPKDVYHAVHDFIEKPIDFRVLTERVHAAFLFDLTERRRDVERDAHIDKLAMLSGRERQVLDLIVSGSLSKQIAASLRISVRTVSRHRENIMRKMGVNNLVALPLAIVAAAEPNRDRAVCFRSFVDLLPATPHN